MLTNPSYNTHGPHTVPHNARPHYAGVNRHDAEVLRKRAISPEVAAECGFYTQGNALRIPHYDIEGDVWAEQRRPHTRRPDGPKYLFNVGTRMGLHIPPSERKKLQDREKPIILTESALKAAAIISDLRRHGLADQYAVVSIPGVTTWRRDGGPIPDFEDFPSRQKEGDKITYRRPLFIVYDSNAATNPNVILARWKTTDYLERVRKHDVQWIDVPEGPGETPKARERGVDDVIAEGIATMPELLARAYAAPTIMPAIEADTTADDPNLSEVERLRARCDTLEAVVATKQRHISRLTELAISPHYTANEKTLIIRSAGLAMVEGAHTKREDGDVEIDPGKLSNDFRPTDKRHPDYEDYKRSPVNPSGEHWYMRRSSVVPTAESLEKKLGSASPLRTQLRSVRNPGDPSPHRETAVIMRPPNNIVDFLDAITAYRPDSDPHRPYQVQEPCPHCGEVHPRKVITTSKTYCEGCGSQYGENETTTRVIPLPVANDPDATGEERADLEERTAGPVNRENLFTGEHETRTNINSESSRPRSPRTRYSEKIFLPGDRGEILEGDAIAGNFPAMDDEPEPDVGRCACGAPLPDGSKWTCGPDCPAGRLEVPA